MGLDTTHNCWHGPYSSFNKFRFQLANRIGINLKDYKGYGEATGKDLASIEHDLMPLFNHSDCDGELNTEEQARIIIGLNDVLESWDMPETLENKWFRDQIIQFRDGCLDAFTNNEVIEFN